MVDRLLVADSISDIPSFAVGVRRFRSGDGRLITHATVFYRDADDKVWSLHFARPRAIVREDRRNMHFGWTVPRAPEFDKDSLSLLADLCDQIHDRYSKNQEVLFGLRYSNDVTFGDSTGEINLGRLRGVTCATFVLAILNSYNFRPLDLDSWEAREDDVEWQHWVAAQFQDDDPLIAADIPCLRYRPEEVVGACLEPYLGVQFERAESLGQTVLHDLDGYLERSGLAP